MVIMIEVATCNFEQECFVIIMGWKLDSCYRYKQLQGNCMHFGGLMLLKRKVKLGVK